MQCSGGERSDEQDENPDSDFPIIQKGISRVNDLNVTRDTFDCEWRKYGRGPYCAALSDGVKNEERTGDNLVNRVVKSQTCRTREEPFVGFEQISSKGVISYLQIETPFVFENISAPM
jgi:hypothetical protein